MRRIGPSTPLDKCLFDALCKRRKGCENSIVEVSNDRRYVFLGTDVMPLMILVICDDACQDEINTVGARPKYKALISAEGTDALEKL